MIILMHVLHFSASTM